MGVGTEDIAKSLTYRTVKAGGRGNDSYTVPLSVNAARDGCDAFAKEVYSKSFNWLVEAINEATCAEENYRHADEVDDFGIIGLLDIFGFESFKINRFEQLCINYANEKLQQKYTLDVFSSVQEEYEYEGISLGDLEYQDNTDVLAVIEGKMGIIAVLNEECVRPNGNDTSFVQKIKTINKDNDPLIDDRLHKPLEFAIQHYAGAVKYDAANFVTKNTDTLPNDLVGCATKSDNKLIAGEFLNAKQSKAEQEAATKPGRGRSSAVTVSATFRSQLSSLMTNIGLTKTRYVRCIKPNPQKKPLEVDLLSSTEQLRCAGVVAAVNVSRAAFPNRLIHSTALERFTCLSAIASKEDGDSDSGEEEKKEDNSQDPADDRASVGKLLDEVLKSMEKKGEDGAVIKAFEVGKSRVYFRQGALEFLEAGRLKALGVYAVQIERIVRGFLARSDFLYKRGSAITFQSLVRCHIARSHFLEKKDAATDISCWVRCINAKVELVRLRRERASTILQAQQRAAVARKNYKTCRSSAITIQKIARGSIQRPKYRVALKEAKEEAVVNKKIAALQKRLAEAEMKLLKANGGVVQVVSKEPSVTEEEVVSEVVEKAVEPKVEQQQPKSSLARAAASGMDKQLMDDSIAMIGVLKKEVFELRSKNFLLRTDLDDLRRSNQSLQSQHASLSLSYDALKQSNAQTLKAKKDMLFQATREKKQAFDAKNKLSEENEALKKQVEELKEQIDEKKSVQSTELARLRAENDRLKAKAIRQNDRGAGGTLTRVTASIAAPVTPPPPPAMRRAAFNTRRATFLAEETPRRPPPRTEEEEEWKLVAPRSAKSEKSSAKSSEGRNPGGSKRRTRGTRAGRRTKGRSSPATSEASREPCSPAGKASTPNRGGRSRRSGGASSKSVPRVPSVSSFSSETSAKNKKKILPYKGTSSTKAPKGVEVSISSSNVNSTLALAAAAGAMLAVSPVGQSRTSPKGAGKKKE
jgi:myosin-5